MFKNYWHKEEVKQSIFIGIIITLVAGLAALLILLNFYFTEKLSQLQSVTLQNNQRLTQIENFLVSLENQLKATSQEKMKEALSGDKK